MSSLSTLLLDDAVRKDVEADCVALINRRVSASRGIGGRTVQAVFAILRRIRPDTIATICARLLPDFCSALEPVYQRYDAASGEDFSEFLGTHRAEVIASLLSVTDQRAERSDNVVLTSGYRRLRPRAEIELQRAIPGIAEIVTRRLAL